MNEVLETMLRKYQATNAEERENAIKEILQEVALAGLSRAGFFHVAAFYGGTCLRLFHGLNRFSEDLDFALLVKDPSFRLEDYFSAMQKEFRSLGIEVEMSLKSKGEQSDVQSAFIKGNTLTLLLHFFPTKSSENSAPSNQKIKVKFEVDLDHPSGGSTEVRYRLLPSPYEVLVFDEATLFAGKIHAVLCREYKSRVKGRDYYDYLFYTAKGTPINLTYLENKLRNTGVFLQEAPLTLEAVKQMLSERFASVDYESAKEDVQRFVHDKQSLELWKKELFLSTLDELKKQ